MWANTHIEGPFAAWDGPFGISGHLFLAFDT